jgi:hypothetical protein
MLVVGVLALSSIVLAQECTFCNLALQNYRQFLTGDCANAMTAVETYGPDPFEFVTFDDQREARQIFCSSACAVQVQNFVNFLYVAEEEEARACSPTIAFLRLLCTTNSEPPAEASNGLCMGDNGYNMMSTMVAWKAACDNSYALPNPCSHYDVSYQAGQKDECERATQLAQCSTSFTCCDWIAVEASTSFKRDATEHCTINGTNHLEANSKKAIFCSSTIL